VKRKRVENATESRREDRLAVCGTGDELVKR
jgi:hypothetical protein